MLCFIFLYVMHCKRRHDLNEYNMLLKQHLEDRESMLTKINHAGQRKQLLQSTNVYNDAFKIWCVSGKGASLGICLKRCLGFVCRCPALVVASALHRLWQVVCMTLPHNNCESVA